MDTVNKRWSLRMRMCLRGTLDRPSCCLQKTDCWCRLGKVDTSLYGFLDRKTLGNMVGRSNQDYFSESRQGKCIPRRSCCLWARSNSACSHCTWHCLRDCRCFLGILHRKSRWLLQCVRMISQPGRPHIFRRCLGKARTIPHHSLCSRCREGRFGSEVLRCQKYHPR